MLTLTLRLVSFRIQDKSVLVVSGCIAGRGKSTLSWTVYSLERSHEIYMTDCNSLGINPNKVRPTKKTMPFKCEELDEKPTEDKNIKVINIGKFFENKEKFWEILR